MVHFTQLSILALLVSSISAVPLNINLGAYSPALVVGDGEISFGGGEGGESARSAAQLMETLSSGAVGAAEGNAAGGAEAQNARVITPDTPAPAPAPAATTEAAPAETPAEGGGEGQAPAAIRKKVLQPRPFVKRGSSLIEDAVKRDLQGFRESLNFAKEAMKNQPEVELGTGAEGSGVGVIVNPGVNV
jgi:hypothetical protein